MLSKRVIVRFGMITLLIAIAVATQSIGLHDAASETARPLPGAPVRIQASASESTPVLLTFNLTSGRCAIQVFQREKELLGKEFMANGTYHRDLGFGDSILLTPDASAKGTYAVQIGNPPFAAMRQWALVLCVATILALVIEARLGPKVDRKRMAQLLAVFFLSGQVVGVVHEYSHALVGRMLGGEVERVIWTNLGGEGMRAIFRSLPAAAQPWMSAAAIVIPTLLGTAMLFWRYAARRQWSWLGGLIVFALGVSLLSNNFTLLLNPGHMLNALRRLGVPGSAASMLARLPALYSASIIVYLLVYQRGLLPSIESPKSGNPTTSGAPERISMLHQPINR